MAWGKSGSTTTTTTGDTVTVSGLSDNKFYVVLGHHLPSGNFRTTYRINNDSSGSEGSSGTYALRKSEDGGSENTTTYQTQIKVGNQDAAYDYFDVSYLVNISTEEKLMINYNMRNGGNGEGNCTNRVDAVGKWANTSSVISRIDAVNDQGGSYASGSNNSVLGSDLTTSAGRPTNVQEGSRWEETDTKKMYHYESPSVTFEDDFSSSPNGWTLNAYGSGQTISGGFYNSPNTPSNGYKAYAFGSPDKFVFDFDWKITNSTMDIPFIILSSDTSGTHSNGGYGDPPSGHKRIQFMVGSGDIKFSSRYNDGGASEENASASSGTEVSHNTLSYFRVIKDGTTITFKWYTSNANREADTNVQQETSAVIDDDDYNNTADYAYLHVGAYGNNGQNELDDFKFYSGVTSPDTAWKELGT